MRTLRVLFILLSLAVAGFANASPSITVYQAVADKYMYKDFDLVAAPCAVAQGGVTTTWKSGTWTDVWYSTGCGKSANEIDLSLGYDGKLDSPLGALNYEVKSAYYFLSGGDGNHLFNPVDDAWYVHFDLGKDIQIGRTSIGLYSRTEFIDGINNLPFFVIERVTVPMLVHVTDRIDARLNLGRVWSLRGNSASPYEVTPSVAYKLTPAISLVLQDYFDYAMYQGVHEARHQFQFQVNWQIQ